MTSNFLKVVDLSKYNDVCLDVIRESEVGNYSFIKGDSSYDTWEHTYFESVLEMYNIFVDEMVKMYPSIQSNLETPEFLYDFSTFLYSCSSTYISPYVEPMSSELEKQYYQYLTLRDTNDK